MTWHQEEYLKMVAFKDMSVPDYILGREPILDPAKVTGREWLETIGGELEGISPSLVDADLYRMGALIKRKGFSVTDEVLHEGMKGVPRNAQFLYCSMLGGISNDAAWLRLYSEQSAEREWELASRNLLLKKPDNDVGERSDWSFYLWRTCLRSRGAHSRETHVSLMSVRRLRRHEICTLLEGGKVAGDVFSTLWYAMARTENAHRRAARRVASRRHTLGGDLARMGTPIPDPCE